MKKIQATEDSLVEDLKRSAFFQGNRQTTPAPQSPGQEPTSGTIAPSYHRTATPTYDHEMVGAIRQAVRQAGKEAANYRFSDEEKLALNDIKHDYRRRKIITSDNQIARIGINFLVEDYRLNGDNSLLAQVLERLNQ